MATEGEEINIKSEDANVVHYIAGYVCRKILAKISHSNKPGLELCVQGLLKNKDDSETSPSSSTDWINAVDRGGLLHVSEGTSMFFLAMEEVVREHLHANKIPAMKDGYKSMVIKAITESEDVKFHWCLLTAECEDEDSKAVFDMIIELWITVRGFSFTSGWLELYKRSKKEGLQRTKALHTQIVL